MKDFNVMDCEGFSAPTVQKKKMIETFRGFNKFTTL